MPAPLISIVAPTVVIPAIAHGLSIRAARQAVMRARTVVVLFPVV
jgi:hypothetical protein